MCHVPAVKRLLPALRRAVCAAVLGLCVGGDARADAPLVVFAAASLHDVMQDLAARYPGDVVVSVGGSGLMARQVVQGAPADAVLLANARWMEWLVDEGAVDPARVVRLLGNALVLIGPKDAPDLGDPSAAALLARLDGGRLAIGQTAGVPAGIYGRQWLEAAGLWDALAPHLAQTDNVRAALALVARGEAPLGIAYATDAAADPGVRVLYAVPDDLHDPIIYPAAALTPRGADFVAFLQGDVARKVFETSGFRPLAARP